MIRALRRSRWRISRGGATSREQRMARYNMTGLPDLHATALPLPGLFRLGGRLGRSLPAGPRDAVLTRIARALAERHPAILQRLAPYSGRMVLIVIDDMGIDLALALGTPIHLGLATVAQQRRADAVIRGAWPALLALLEGRADGDALFFSRDIAIEGATDLVLAIRNAIDGAGIDLLRDIAGACGPLAPLVRRTAPAMMNAALRAAGLIDAAHRALLAPALRRCDSLSEELTQARLQVTALAAVPSALPRRRHAAND
jgi:predicted lipid carrier protein YhbT